MHKNFEEVSLTSIYKVTEVKEKKSEQRESIGRFGFGCHGNNIYTEEAVAYEICHRRSKRGETK